MRVNQVASSGTVGLQGVAELKAALAELGNEVATKVGRRADRVAAQAFAKALKENAPYKPGVQRKKGKDYGDLRDNIRVRLAKARKEGTITYNVTTGNAFWARFLEFGTVNMTARPFMRPTFDAMARVLIDRQTVELRTGIDRAAKRIAAKNKVSSRVLPNGRNA